jgi:hypothetical protein
MQRLLKYEYWFLLPLLLSAILSLRSFWQKWPKQYRWFSVLLIVSFLTEALAISWKWHLHNQFSKNNFWIYNSYVTIRFVLLLGIFYQIIQAPGIKKAIRYAGPIIVSFNVLNYLFLQGPFQYNTYSVVLTQYPIVLLCLGYFKQLSEENIMVLLHKEPMVWMAFGTFMYSAVSLPFLTNLNLLNMLPFGIAMSSLPINMTLNLLMCFFYLISFLCRPQSTQYYPS